MYNTDSFRDFDFDAPYSGNDDSVLPNEYSFDPHVIAKPQDVGSYSTPRIIFYCPCICEELMHYYEFELGDTADDLELV